MVLVSALNLTPIFKKNLKGKDFLSFRKDKNLSVNQVCLSLKGKGYKMTKGKKEKGPLPSKFFAFFYSIILKGSVLFHSPLVKSGNFWGIPSWAIETELNGPTALHKAPS